MFVVAFDHKRRAAAALFHTDGLLVTRSIQLVRSVASARAIACVGAQRVSLFPQNLISALEAFLDPLAFFLRDLNN